MPRRPPVTAIAYIDGTIVTTNLISPEYGVGKLDDKIAPKVTSLLEKYGRTVTLRTFPNISEDKSTGKVALGTPRDYTIYASAPLNYSRNLIDGETIKEGDCYVIIAKQVIVPSAGMQIIDDRTWSIVGVKTHTPQNQAAAFELQLRGTGS